MFKWFWTIFSLGAPDEVKRWIWEVTHYPTVNSLEVLVQTRSIFPWLVRVVSDRSAQYRWKHPWKPLSSDRSNNDRWDKKVPSQRSLSLRWLESGFHMIAAIASLEKNWASGKWNQNSIGKLQFAAIAEKKKVQRSQRSYGNHSLDRSDNDRWDRNVAITWKPGSKDIESCH